MSKPSIGYWVICGLALLWHAFGAFDYAMTAMGHSDMSTQASPEALAYYNALPVWLFWPWAVAIWGAIAGWILMLLRSKWAVSVFVFALICLLVNVIYFAVTGGYPIMGLMESLSMMVTLAIAVFAVWFSYRERARGTLR